MFVNLIGEERPLQLQYVCMFQINLLMFEMVKVLNNYGRTFECNSHGKRRQFVLNLCGEFGIEI